MATTISLVEDEAKKQIRLEFLNMSRDLQKNERKLIEELKAIYRLPEALGPKPT